MHSIYIFQGSILGAHILLPYKTFSLKFVVDMEIEENLWSQQQILYKVYYGVVK